jgi:hypothetical protein
MWEFEFDYGELNFVVEWTVTQPAEPDGLWTPGTGEVREIQAVSVNGWDIENFYEDGGDNVLYLIISKECRISKRYPTGEPTIVCEERTIYDLLEEQMYKEDTPY